MCFNCYQEVGVRIGWYEIPPKVRERIVALFPGHHPIPFVKLRSAPLEDNIGIRREEELIRDEAIVFDWFSDQSVEFQRHHGQNAGSMVILVGNAHWIMRPYLRAYKGYINMVRHLQELAREKGGAVYVEYRLPSWTYGVVSVTYDEKHDGNRRTTKVAEFRSTKELVELMEEAIDVIENGHCPELIWREGVGR